jgi:hypothetical protein
MKVFVASEYPTDYPRKLQKPGNITQRIRDTADTFILDSGIGDDTTNKEVLEYADEYNADYVIAKDYLHDRDRTTESVREFLELYESHPCNATPMIPLQPPHHKHYRDLPGYSHYVLGGMSVPEFSTQDRIRFVLDFAREVDGDPYTHALGVGGGRTFAEKMAPLDILDSVDCATPEIAAKSGKVIRSDFTQRHVTVHQGEGASRRNHPLAEFNSWQLQDLWDKLEADASNGTQSGLGEFV